MQLGHSLLSYKDIMLIELCQGHVQSVKFFRLNIYILGVSHSVQVSSLSLRSVSLFLDHLCLATTLSCLVLFLFLFTRMSGMSSSLTR